MDRASLFARHCHINVPASTLRTAMARHCRTLTQPFALASALNLLPCNILQILHTRLIWLDLHLCALSWSWDGRPQCPVSLKDFWSTGMGVGPAQVAQPTAHTTATCFQESCWLSYSCLCPQKSHHPWESTGKSKIMNSTMSSEWKE